MIWQNSKSSRPCKRCKHRHARLFALTAVVSVVLGQIGELDHIHLDAHSDNCVVCQHLDTTDVAPSTIPGTIALKAFQSEVDIALQAAQFSFRTNQLSRAPPTA